MLPMMRDQTMKSWRSAEQWLLGSMVLAMAACIRLVRGPAPAAPAYLTAVSLLIASLLASLIMALRVRKVRKDGSVLWVRATFQFALPLHREDST
jgi:hypothetical protein